MSRITHIQTHTGRVVDLLRPDPGTIDLWDIAWALGHICRFTGHTGEFYSVAQHSMLVADYVRATEPSLELAGLLHDAEEAYLGDWSSPLKNAMRRLLRAHQWQLFSIVFYFKKVIGFRFDVDLANESPVVKAADRLALSVEVRDLMMLQPEVWHLDAEPFGPTIVPLKPVEAAVEFYNRARRLLASRLPS